jgi:hypothetical protein
LGEEVAGVGREIVGEDDVVGGVRRFIPTELSDGCAGSHGLVFSLALEADKFSGFRIDGGLGGIGAGLDGGGEGDGDRAEGVGRIDRDDLDARSEVRTIHQEVVARLGVIADLGGEIRR